jgi:hypothetical protein
MPPVRSTEEIRQSIQTARTDLTASINELQVKVAEIADWRGHLRSNPTVALAGAAAAGFVLGGGIGGFFGLFSRR